MNPQALLALLGVRAVLLPIPKGKKCPFLNGWSTVTYAKTQTPAYQLKLESHGNTGVLLGKASENLCSIDFDEDEALSQFLALNPSLQDTLRTAGKRGANLWIVLTDDYPPSHTLKDSEGNPVGEWRAAGNQTIIQGVHPEGMDYRLVVEKPAMRVSYAEINWGEVKNKPLGHIDSEDDIETQIIQKNYKIPKTSLIVKEQKAEEAMNRLKGNHQLFHLYKNYVLHKFTPRQGERNSQLVSMITFLSRAVSEQQALHLAEAYYTVNQDVFADTLEQHMHEARSHLKATLRRWEEEMSEEEKTLVNGLPPRQREAYRICENLALHESEQHPRGVFFLSCADLGKRLDTNMKTAHRILAQLEGMGIVSIQNKGTRHTKLARGRATVYEWTASQLPPLAQSKPS